MKRYVAFLRGVMPFNCKMADLRAAFGRAGFADVTTVIGSGNVVFSAPAQTVAKLQRACEAAMDAHMGRVFLTVARSIDDLRALLASDPYQGKRLPADAKRIVTFLRDKPRESLGLPRAIGQLKIVAATDREVFSYYRPLPGAQEFMQTLEKVLGKDQTTRTWQTIEKCAR